MTKHQPPTDTPTASEPREGVVLTVRASHIRLPGSGRVHAEVLETMGRAQKDLVEVVHDARSVAVHVFGDRHVAHDHIVLRRTDMHRLGVSEGDPVTVRGYTSSRQAVRGAMRRTATRLGRRMDLVESEGARGGGE